MQRDRLQGTSQSGQARKEAKMDNYWMVNQVARLKMDDLLSEAASARRFLSANKSRLAAWLQTLIIIFG